MAVFSSSTTSLVLTLLNGMQTTSGSLNFKPRSIASFIFQPTEEHCYLKEIEDDDDDVHVLFFFHGSFDSVSTGELTNRVLTLNRMFSSDQDSIEAVRERDTKKHARLLTQGASDGVLNFTLGGAADGKIAGLYYTTIQLGSPPREFNVMIDTGSDPLWVRCNSCIGCPRFSSLGIGLNDFDPATSHSAMFINCPDSICHPFGDCDPNNKCSFNIEYGDKSGTSGYFLSDLLYLDEILPNSTMKGNSTPIVFACSTQVSGSLTLEYGALDGILGLGHKHASILSQLSSEEILPNVFSHCLKGDGGGVLVLGEILDDKIVHSPLDLSTTYYNLYLESISVSEQPLPIKESVYKTSHRRTTFVDSGTTLIYMVPEAYRSLINVVTDIVSQHATPVIQGTFQCYKLTRSSIGMFPRVSFHFSGNASISLGPEDYLLDDGPIDGVMSRCIGFQSAMDTYEDVTILGEMALKDKIVVYDVAHQRIGWADYDCNKPVNVSKAYGKDYYITSTGSKNASANLSFFFILIFLLILC